MSAPPWVVDVVLMLVGLRASVLAAAIEAPHDCDSLSEVFARPVRVLIAVACALALASRWGVL